MVLNISKAIFKILVDFMNDVIEKIVAELLKKMWNLVQSFLSSRFLHISATSHQRKRNFWMFGDILSQSVEIPF